MLSHFTVTMRIYGGSKGQIDTLVWETSPSFFLSVSIVMSSAIATVWEFGKGFCS